MRVLCPSFKANQQYNASDYLDFLLKYAYENEESLSCFKIGILLDDNSLQCVSCGYLLAKKINLFVLRISILSPCLQSLVDSFFRELIIERECPNCSILNQVKDFSIEEIPGYIAISLNLFDSDLKKNERVSFSDQLILNIQNQEIFYEITSIIMHSGSTLSNGHFLSCNKTRLGWKIFDEENVYDFNEDFAENFYNNSEFAACLIFFRRKGSPADFLCEPDQKILDIIKKDNFLYEVEMSCLF